MKRVKKLYLNDASFPVPRRTLFRNASRAKRSTVDKEERSPLSPTAGFADFNEDMLAGMKTSDQDLKSDNSEEASTSHSHEHEPEEELENISNGGSTVVLGYNEQHNEQFHNHDSEENELEWSDSQSDTDLSTDSSDASSSESESFESVSDEEGESENNCYKQDCKFTALQLQSLAMIAFLLRHNLTGVAANDLLGLIKVICPGSSELAGMKCDELFQVIDHVNCKMCHYCSVCHNVFPQNVDSFSCETPECSGLRYRGGLAAQTKPNRLPRQFFVLADVKSQLRYLLEQDGLLAKILDVKKKAKTAKTSHSSTVTDITDGKYYRHLLEEGQFLANENCISGMFNTDGIPLYKSAHVKLWPIFLAINEIPLRQRFSRENMVLVGIWQGKGSPPFLQYMNKFGEEMCSLYHEGIPVSMGGNVITIKLGIFLGIVDLQAKSYILHMTMHNGESGCCTCEEPGKTVKQGKGHARCYPYRKIKEKFPLRDSDDIKYNLGPKATAEGKRIKGVHGISGLTSMPWFDMVLGIVPDYMHGVLMGVTKTLLHKWFSPSQSKQPFFIGNHLRSISRRLTSIKPPDYIERLPRDLEKHFAHLKATELQAWLLYYALPCLSGYLPAKYLKHFAHLSEGIHLLLGDCITELDLERAESLLDAFYREFSQLYGEGSCGLNVHNVGAHLVFYVRLWGPIFAWSCFGFEHWNAVILQAVHGTGDVTRQILCHVHAQLQLKSFFVTMPKSDVKDYISRLIKPARQWKITQNAKDCTIPGAVLNLPDLLGEELQLIKDATGEQDISQLNKALRVQYGLEKLYAKDYKRMKKRICYVVLTKKGEIIAIKYFVYCKNSKRVFALAQPFVLDNECFIFSQSGHHILRVNEMDGSVIIPVCEIQEKLFFLSFSESVKFVIRMPNMHGHGLLK